ncbi:MAG: putative acyl-CoA synthetase [Frankiales bacterium]|jgi:acetyltransferase|nr:putative acyl-CoA synthetase [Frankiales bacterium]
MTTLLVDGQLLTVRPVRAEDTAALITMHRGLSEQTVYQRFLAGRPELAHEQADRFTHVDGTHRVALVAEDPDGHLVAVVRYDRQPPDYLEAEVAIVVTDRFQHHGLGTELVRMLIARAGAAGVETFLADVLTTNAAMHRTFADAGLKAWTSSYGAGVSHLVMPLRPADVRRPA